MENRRIKILGFSFLLGGFALCLLGLWLLMKLPQFLAVVDIGELESGDFDYTNYGYSYPYAIQYTVEQLQSPIVLGKVINILDLDSAWKNEHFGGQNQKGIGETNLLRQRLSFSSIPATCNGRGYGSHLKLIEIHMRDKNPNLALKIVDAMPQAFRDFRFEQIRQRMLGGVHLLSERYEKEESEIKSKRDLVETRRRLDLLPSPEPVEEVIRTNYPEYFEAKLGLKIAEDTHKLLRARIDTEQVYSKIEITNFASSIYITKAVIDPKVSATPYSSFGVLLMGIGLFPIVGGFLLLKTLRNPPASS